MAQQLPLAALLWICCFVLRRSCAVSHAYITAGHCCLLLCVGGLVPAQRAPPHLHSAQEQAAYAEDVFGGLEALELEDEEGLTGSRAVLAELKQGAPLKSLVSKMRQVTFMSCERLLLGAWNRAKLGRLSLIQECVRNWGRPLV
jgi:hypothetical protein